MKFQQNKRIGQLNFLHSPKALVATNTMSLLWKLIYQQDCFKTTGYFSRKEYSSCQKINRIKQIYEVKYIKSKYCIWTLNLKQGNPQQIKSYSDGVLQESPPCSCLRGSWQGSIWKTRGEFQLSLLLQLLKPRQLEPVLDVCVYIRSLALHAMCTSDTLLIRFN